MRREGVGGGGGGNGGRFVEDTFAYSSFFPLPSVHRWQGSSLITFVVVFTNVSFIKRQQPGERHHPAAKVEVIINLNHLTAYLFGRLSQAQASL